MKLFIEMSRAAYDRELWAQPFDALLDCARKGAEGLNVLEADDGVTFRHNSAGERLEYTWSEGPEKDRKHFVVKVTEPVAFFRRGSDGRAYLHAQAW